MSSSAIISILEESKAQAAQLRFLQPEEMCGDFDQPWTSGPFIPDTRGPGRVRDPPHRPQLYLPLPALAAPETQFPKCHP